MTGARVLLTIQLAFAAAFHAAPTSAAVIERDLVPGSGDGLLTFDDVNNREWLDVPETLLSQFAPGQSLNVALNIALTELEPGGRFEEFTWATQADVFALAESAGIDTLTSSLVVNETATRNVIGLLGDTVFLPSSNTVSTWGLIDEFSGDPPVSRLVANFVVVPPSGGAGFGTFASSDFGIDSPQNSTGIMLYRNVSEPSSCFLLVLSVVPLICVRRQLTVTC